MATACLAFAAPAFSAAPVELTEVTQDYDLSAPHFDLSFRMAMLDAGWLPLTVAAGEATAEIKVHEHYAKVLVRLGDGKATFTLIDSRELRAEACAFRKGSKLVKGMCIHPAYYDWLANIKAAFPLAQARIQFVKSLGTK